ncbi:MAG: NGG1p interacting factor NIF3 [Candidatus Magasanikbacteria bacterium]|jgi:hypothetical protein
MLTVRQVFETGVKLGMAADPRGPKILKKYLDRIKRDYEELKVEDKKYFDKSLLENPYSDSLIHNIDEKTQVKRVLAGIDIGSGEVLLASQLNERGKTIDLVIGHHPIGKALAGLHDVMDMTVDIYESLGMPIHIAEKVMEERIKEVGRSTHPINNYQLIDLAKILKVNLINTHTITDNLVLKFVQSYLEEKHPDTLGEVVEALMEIPEYQEAKHRGVGPKIISGSPRNRVGKFLIEMTGGTNPSSKVYESLSRAGVSTIIGMHMRDDSMNKANEHSMNIVIAGHISSDSLGMNLFLDELEKKGIEIVPCSGLIRVSRVKKGKK